MFTERLQVQLIVGSDSLPQSALDATRAKLADKYGGTTMISCEGQWAENGAEFLNFYGNIVTEAAYMLLLTMVPADFDMAYIQEACLPMAAYADWIHMETHKTEAAHFSLKALAVNLTNA